MAKRPHKKAQNTKIIVPNEIRGEPFDVRARQSSFKDEKLEKIDKPIYHLTIGNDKMEDKRKKRKLTTSSGS